MPLFAPFVPQFLAAITIAGPLELHRRGSPRGHHLAGHHELVWTLLRKLPDLPSCRTPDHTLIPSSILPGGHRRPFRRTWFPNRTPSSAGIDPLEAIRFHSTFSPLCSAHTFLGSSLLLGKIGNYMCVHLALQRRRRKPEEPKAIVKNTHTQKKIPRRRNQPKTLKPNR